jgi:hypothetical protein
MDRRHHLVGGHRSLGGNLAAHSPCLYTPNVALGAIARLSVAVLNSGEPYAESHYRNDHARIGVPS